MINEEQPKEFIIQEQLQKLSSENQYQKLETENSIESDQKEDQKQIQESEKEELPKKLKEKVNQFHEVSVQLQDPNKNEIEQQDSELTIQKQSHLSQKSEFKYESEKEQEPENIDSEVFPDSCVSTTYQTTKETDSLTKPVIQTSQTTDNSMNAISDKKDNSLISSLAD